MKKNIFSLTTLIIFLCNQSFAQAKIKIYFTNPVDTSVAKMGVNAVYLSDGAAADTIAAYIDRATSTVDIAQYDFTNTGTTSPIITAMNNAASRGVRVRYVFDSGESVYSSAIDLFSSSITILGRPIDYYYGYIMHDKYIIIDGKTVETGSFNYTVSAERRNAENVVVIKNNKKLAEEYMENWKELWDEGKEYQ